MNSELKISTLVDLVNYKDESVVSKTLIKKDTGTITLFAFDQGQSLSEHTASFDALVFVLDGEVEITISDHPFILNPGEIIIMPANEPHAVKAIKKFKMMLTMIKSWVGLSLFSYWCLIDKIFTIFVLSGLASVEKVGNNRFWLVKKIYGIIANGHNKKMEQTG